MSLSLKLTLAACLAVGAAVAAMPAQAAAKKEAPGCAAVSFRPVPSGMMDGVHDAGLYKSRFAKMELKALVESGEPKDYYLEVNGKRLEPAKDVPKGSEACLKSKHVRVPVLKMEKSCVGSRFRVVVFNPGGDKKTAMLFGLKGDDWNLCSASHI